MEELLCVNSYEVIYYWVFASSVARRKWHDSLEIIMVWFFLIAINVIGNRKRS